MFQKLDGKIESVHLCNYPEVNEKYLNKDLEKEMEKARDIVNLCLAQRSKLGIKVRQPLLWVKIKNKIEENILDLVKEEINVKDIIIDKTIKEEIELNEEITPELKEEGLIRDIVRHIQQMRKEQGFVPKDKIIVHYEKSDFFDSILLKNKERILNEVLGCDFKKEDFLDGKKILIEKEIINLKIDKLYE
jgi:isoleucyl-tRNA synthetase